VATLIVRVMAIATYNDVAGPMVSAVAEAASALNKIKPCYYLLFHSA